MMNEWMTMILILFVRFIDEICMCVFVRTHTLAVRNSTVGRRNDSFVGEKKRRILCDIRSNGFLACDKTHHCDAMIMMSWLKLQYTHIYIYIQYIDDAELFV